MQRIGCQNLIELRPPRWSEVLLATHPALHRRIQLPGPGAHKGAYEAEQPIVVRTPLGPPPLALRVAAVVAVPLLLYALVATGQKALDNYRLNQEAGTTRRRGRTSAGEHRAAAADRAGPPGRGDRDHRARATGAGQAWRSPLILSATRAAACRSPQPCPSGRQPIQPTWRQWVDLFFG